MSEKYSIVSTVKHNLCSNFKTVQNSEIKNEMSACYFELYLKLLTLIFKISVVTFRYDSKHVVNNRVFICHSVMTVCMYLFVMYGRHSNMYTDCQINFVN